MAEKCWCGADFAEEGTTGKCKNGHEKKKKLSQYVFPLDEPAGAFKGGQF